MSAPHLPPCPPKEPPGPSETLPGPSVTRRAVLSALGAPAVLGACGTSSTKDAGAGDYPARGLQILAPADPGSGWDQTARTLATVVEQSRLTDNGVQVKNVPGAGGTVGLGQFAGQRDPDALMVMGLVMLGAISTNKSPATMASVTPIARLASEYEVLVVPAASPFKSLDDFVTAFKKDPAAVSVVGGSAGGVDQVLAALVARQVGVDPARVNYTPYAGGGATIPVLLSGEADAGINGVAQYAEQIQAGKLRPLAVSAPKRVPVLDAPTFIEQGVEVTIENWRGIVAPKTVSAAQKRAITDFITQVYGTEGWRKALVTNGWNDRYLAGPEFDTYIASEQKRIDGVLADLGLVKK